MSPQKVAHIFLRAGDGLQGENEHINDKYQAEFDRRGMRSISVSPIKFVFRNIDKLAEIIKSVQQQQQQQHTEHNKIPRSYGLILMSPRAVDSMAKAMEMALNSGKEARYGCNQKENPVFKSELVFAVGESTKQSCIDKLGIELRNDSASTGNADALIEYIKTWQHDNATKCPTLTLINPCSSRPHKDTLSNVGSINIIDIETYEKVPVDDLTDRLMEAVNKLNVIDSDTPLVIINLIFFSPTALVAYSHNEFISRIHRVYTQQPKIEIKFSSIGTTTQRALIDQHFEVDCVASKPNPISLANSIARVFPV